MYTTAIVKQFETQKKSKKRQLVSKSYEVLHVAFEYQAAILGGLGVVATQMVTAQNIANQNSKDIYKPYIVTPFYPQLFKYPQQKLEVYSEVQHLYQDKLVTSVVYCVETGLTKHFMVCPKSEFTNLFAINNINYIYCDKQPSDFIDRVLYFSSAVAAFAQNLNPNIILLHDWHTALVAKILRDVYSNTKIKSIFIVHVGNMDCGSYRSSELQGVGIDFAQGSHLLKIVGIENSDKVVAVSPSFLRECMQNEGQNAAEKAVQRAFLLTSMLDNNKIISILNGFDFNKFCQLGKVLTDPNDIVASKYKIKKQLSSQLSSWISWTKINPNLPVIFYIGRFSDEKGVKDFLKLLEIIKGRAVFFALGRGLTDSVYEAMQKYNYTDNVFISNREEDQAKYSTLMRACADFIFIPSRRESFCCVAPEGLANGSLCVTTRVGGLESSVFPLCYADKNNTSGNGFVYDYTQTDMSDTTSLPYKLDEALCFWNSLKSEQKNKIHLRLMHEAKGFDWLARNGAIEKYSNLFGEMIAASPQTTIRPVKSKKHKLNI